jgi:hypothetical protein
MKRDINQINVTLEFDPEASIWWIKECDVSGVCLEAQTIDALIARLPDAVRDIWDVTQVAYDHGASIEIIAHTSRIFPSSSLAA